MNLFFIISFLSAIPAQALFCKSAAEIENTLQLCDDNQRFAVAAKTCRNDFIKAVFAEQSALSNALKLGVSAAKNGNAQNGTEGVSASTYDKAITELDTLIARGVATEVEEKDYIAHFMAPFHWSTRDLGPMPRRNDPVLWKAYDREFCFGEHRETIDHMIKDIDKAVTDLRSAKKNAADLKGSSLEHGDGLGNTAGKAASSTYGTSAPAGAAGGTSSNGASDITGVQQDKAKQGGQ